MSGRRAVIIPGNGAGDVAQSNWYGWANRKLNEIDGFTSTLRNMPDPMTARYKILNSFMYFDHRSTYILSVLEVLTQLI